MDADDQPRRRRGALPFFCLLLGFAIAAGSALFLAAAWLNGPDWASVGGVVTRNTVEVDTRTFGRHQAYHTRYTPAIEYHYRVGGTDYRGQGIGDGIDRSYDNPADALAAMAPYRRGPLTVYYDRADPGRSALDTGIVSRFVLILGGIGLVLVAIGFILRYADSLEEPPPADDPADEREEFGDDAAGDI